jgi:hypothetical protein
MQIPRLARGLRRLGLGRRVVLGEPARRIVTGVEADLSFTLGSLLRAPLGEAMLQTFASSFSFWASAMTFWATCDGTSSYRANDMW